MEGSPAHKGALSSQLPVGGGNRAPWENPGEWCKAPTSDDPELGVCGLAYLCPNVGEKAASGDIDSQIILVFHFPAAQGLRFWPLEIRLVCIGDVGEVQGL